MVVAGHFFSFQSASTRVTASISVRSLDCPCFETARIIAMSVWFRMGLAVAWSVCIIIDPFGMVAMWASLSLTMSVLFSGESCTNPSDLGVLSVRLSVCALSRALRSTLGLAGA